MPPVQPQSKNMKPHLPDQEKIEPGRGLERSKRVETVYQDFPLMQHFESKLAGI